MYLVREDWDEAEVAVEAASAEEAAMAFVRMRHGKTMPHPDDDPVRLVITHEGKITVITVAPVITVKWRAILPQSPE